MNVKDTLFRWLNRVNPRVMRAAEQTLKAVPGVDARMEQEYASMLGELEHSLKPYAGEFDAYAELPKTGRDRELILDEMEQLNARERGKWQEGFVSGAVYHGDAAYIEFLNRVYALNSQSNPLHADVFPATSKFEAEIVSMTAHLLGADETNDIVGTVTSGGTESILLAMKTYRDFARDKKGIAAPEIIAPVSAHAAFDKAAQYFNLKLVHIPLDAAMRADVDAARRALNKNTIALIGSAPCFPYGTLDPIQELSELAYAHDIGFHTDACLGGFVLPFAEKLGYPVPPFDFRLRGVTSMSADTHKYGYAAKGTSVVLYRGRALRHYQYYTATDWSGGLYFSPTFAGSRPGALSATAWAALVSIGQAGYLEATRAILETATKIKNGIRELPELKILGDPLWVIAFASATLDIYKVMDALTQRGWSLNGLHKPAAVHLALTQRHTVPGVAERFLADLRDAVAYVKAHPKDKGAMAPVYGLAANLPLRGVVSDLLKRYMDVLYKV
ncbi:aminotransferase class V-fold PLP-dependent enzyme [Anaerolineae bacterium CFX7]|nr:aminotransferase class V-fold PLP-dependent enzyme [Anaerolineae bacterium CFX7]